MKKKIDIMQMPTIQIACICLLIVAACTKQRPVLYPNDYLQYVGHEASQADIDDCMHLAAQFSPKSATGKELARDAAENSAVGGATGAAVGAVYGNAGRGAGAGAAGAGVATVTRGLLRSGRPDPVFRRFVEKCLRDKGYSPIGWH